MSSIARSRSISARARTALRQDGETIAYPPGTTNYHFEVELVVALGAPAFKIAEGGRARRRLRLRRRPRHDAARPATLRARQAAAVDARQGRRGERAGLGHRPGRAHRPSRQEARSRCARTALVKQNADIGELVWSVPEIIAHLSGFYHLGAGDLIFTGTPAGVGPVAPGDRLEGAIDGVGALAVAIGPRNEPATDARAIGVISGTSMDGIDVALIDGDGETQRRARPRRDLSLSRRRRRARCARSSPIPTRARGPLDDLERDVTDAHVAAVEAFLSRPFAIAPREPRAGRPAWADGPASPARALHAPALRRRARGARGSASTSSAISARPTSRRAAKARRWSRSITPRSGDGLERPLMLLNWGGVGNVTYLGATARSSPSTPAPPMR